MSLNASSSLNPVPKEDTRELLPLPSNQYQTYSKTSRTIPKISRSSSHAHSSTASRLTPQVHPDSLSGHLRSPTQAIHS